jgi:tetratricopeptide (TPR) repeat protein
MAAFWTHWGVCQAKQAGEALLLAAQHAARAGDNGLRCRALGWYAMTLLYGPQPAVTITRELDAIDRQEPGPYLLACVHRTRGEVARLRGDLARAHAMADQANEGFRVLGNRLMASLCWMTTGWWSLQHGDLARGRDVLLQCDAALEQLGARDYRSTAQALLAQAYSELGDSDAALSAIERCEALGGPEDLTNLVLTHLASSRLALAAGDWTTAQRSANSAIDYASRTDFSILHGDAHIGAARIHAALGDRERAAVEARRALDVYVAKQDRPGIARASGLMQK